MPGNNKQGIGQEKTNRGYARKNKKGICQEKTNRGYAYLKFEGIRTGKERQKNTQNKRLERKVRKERLSAPSPL